MGELLPAGHCLCHSSITFECQTCLDCMTGDVKEENGDSTRLGEWKFDYRRDGAEEGLSEAQCMKAFPGLFEDVGRAVRRRDGKRIEIAELERMKMYTGMVRAMIHGNEVRFWS